MPAASIRIAASILAADFARLGEQVKAAEQAGADRIHIDVMDGHFVPNLSMGTPIVQSVRKITKLPLEVHLMILNPDAFVDQFVAAGADSLIVHWEGNNNLHRTVERIKALGKGVAVAINPATPASVLEEILPDIHQVLVMTVDPGFGHQKFIHTTLGKLQRVRQMIADNNCTCDIEVDGGIDPTTAPLAVGAGANVLVAGTAVFGAKDGVPAAIAKLQSAAAQAR